MDHTEKENTRHENTILDLSKFAKLTSYIIAVIATFSLVHAYFYYCLFLHVPVFQYLELYDLLLMGSSGVFWALYVGASESARFVSTSNLFDKKQRVYYSILIWGFIVFLCIVGYRNDPMVIQIFKTPLRFWFFWIPPFIIYIIIRLKTIKQGNDFFRRNRYVAVFVLTIWYVIFDSFLNYQIIIEKDASLHYKVKLKNGQVIETGKSLKYAGRTRDYWFFYNSSNKIVRAINKDRIETVDFDSKTL